MDWMALLTAFGLGSIVSALVQALLKRSEVTSNRRFTEKREAFIGFLEAYASLATLQTDAAAKQFAYWEIRCQIVAHKRVSIALAELKQSAPDSQERDAAHAALIEAMRRDLQVS